MATAKELAVKQFEDEWDKTEAIRLARQDAHDSRDFKVYHGGPHPAPKMGAMGSHGWNTGDIDFDTDGSIFIRNPYLANAIEECIAKNYPDWAEWAKRRANAPARNPGPEPILFRLTRDEGWSGEKQNIIC